MAFTRGNLTPLEHLWVDAVCIRRVTEIINERMQKDISRFESLDPLDQLYVRAYWMDQWSLLFDACQEESLTLPVTTEEDFAKQTECIDRRFRTKLTRANKCAESVKKRLESAKRMVGDKFAKEFKDLVNRFDIASPIEHLFLIEWQFANVESRFQVDLQPQAEITTAAGLYHVDFLITSKTMGELELAIVVELDGHEFHEKTKEQVAKDNRRTRALTQSSMTVLRFSGHEITRDSRGCIDEVVAMIEKLRQ